MKWHKMLAGKLQNVTASRFLLGDLVQFVINEFTNMCCQQLRHSISAGSLLSPSYSSRYAGSSSDAISTSMTSSDDRLIVKVFLATEDSDEVVHYKSILVSI